MLFRNLLVAVILCSILLLLVPSVHAQGAILNDVKQEASWVYGESINFTLAASAEQPLTGARISVQVQGRDQVYSELVEVAEGRRIDLSHSFSVRTIELPPFANLTYFWDLVDSTGTAYRTDVQSIQYIDTRVPWNWQGITQADITVYTDGVNDSVGTSAIDIATNALTTAERLLNVRYDGQMAIYVYPSLTSLADSLRRHGHRIDDWVAAYALPSQQIALVATGSENIGNSLNRDLPHVVMHNVIRQHTALNDSELPGWYVEGLAIFVADVPEQTLDATFRDALREDGLLPLQELCRRNFTHLSPNSRALAFAQSEKLVRYILEHYGASAIQQLREVYGAGASCQNGIEQTLNMPLAELESKWQNAMTVNRAESSDEDPSLIPWVVIWAISIGLAILFVAPQPSRQTYLQNIDPDSTQPISTIKR